MTPKEKAEELVNKMYNTEHCGIKHIPNQRYCDCSDISYFQSKQCALIAVDEIIEELAEIWGHYGNIESQIEERQSYWLEIKQEIEKL
jgi:hypothetical protein